MKEPITSTRWVTPLRPSARLYRSAALTALALFAAYMGVAKIDAIAFPTPVMACFYGAMLPYLFSVAIDEVNAAMSTIKCVSVAVSGTEGGARQDAGQWRQADRGVER